LREAIVAGTLNPGERLDEDRLSRELGVSRTPLREALQELEHEGLVISRPRQGTFVVDLGDEEIQKINSLRIVLEAEALRLCRKKFTPQIERKLLTLVEKMEEVCEQASVETAFLVWEFHKMIWRWSGNDCLERVLNTIATPLFIARALQHPHTSSTRHHRTMMEFIQGTCQQSAEEVMLDHLRLRYTISDEFSTFGLAPQNQPNVPGEPVTTAPEHAQSNLPADRKQRNVVEQDRR
jgi:DNA-binding GntR family transcriptional regulator